MADAFNIQTTGSNISRHNNINLAFLQSVNRALTNSLTQIAIQRRRGETTSFQALSNIDSRRFGAHKNDHAIKSFNF